MDFIFAQIADPISGGAGWVGAGLLGLVMSWLLMVHLPSKDKQLRELIDGKDSALKDVMGRQETEREKERLARHEMAGLFQRTIAEISVTNSLTADKDREIFVQRLDAVRSAVEKQTTELKTAIMTSCRANEYQCMSVNPPPSPPVRKH